MTTRKSKGPDLRLALVNQAIVCEGNNGLDSPLRSRFPGWIQLVVATP
ncbi:hypothetical protein ACQX25_10725 [Corynebacterium diphtheriae]|nr:hypothetical protein [Corynebacterium diphtheriae]MBN4651803.1 hypothetical protein [Corynebacterium diphtheriae bv. mitis]MBN4654042.1 hypothetical protein [Corynebacterium diphtheriae bv. mitis]